MASPNTYIPVDIAAAFRRQAWTAWLVGLGAVAVWTAVTVAAPLARLAGFASIASPIYGFFSYLCHQMPERSMHLAGEPFAVCSRCFGIYAGLVAGFAIYPLGRRIEEVEPIRRVWLFLALVPVGIDWSLTAFGIWENTHATRLITGGILGVACATFIVPATVEIARNVALRRRNFR